MENSRFAGDPLLYIQQPGLSAPKAPMQHDYKTPKKSEWNNQIKVNEPAKKISRKRKVTKARSLLHVPIEDDNIEELNQETEENIVEENQEEEDIESDDLKFNDMTIREKVDYFVNSPDYAPRLRCEIKTETNTFRGIITESKDNDVFIRVGRRASSTKVPFDDIKNIRILGF